jgi:adenylate cyclase
MPFNGAVSVAAPAERERRVRTIWRRHKLVGWLSNAIGIAVAFASIGFLIAVFLEPGEEDQLFRDNWYIVLAAFVIGGLVINWLQTRTAPGAFGWVIEGRQPDEREQRVVLRWPLRQAVLSLAAWDIGGLAIALLNLDHSLGFAALVLATACLAGEATSAMVYLFSERVQRPITALALAAGPPDGTVAPGIRSRLLYAWSLGTGVPIFGVIVVAIVGLTKPGVETESVAAACLFLGAVAVVVGMVATMVSARAIADPVSAVREALTRVADGDLAAEVRIDDASEVGQLQAGFNRMAQDLRERERIRDLFGRHVGEDVARAALRGGRTRLGGEEREIGALFVDLVGSTSMALAMPPTEVVRLLNRFFRVVVEVVETEGGHVNKFEGDAALCVFGAPVASDDPAGDALRAARILTERLDLEVPEIGFGIGVSAGRAISGNVGAESRFEYTVIGDPVNEAARLCELAKEREERLVASDAALSRAREEEAAAWELGERTILRGRLEATGLASPRA